jgi:hypothetical protein
MASRPELPHRRLFPPVFVVCQFVSHYVAIVMEIRSVIYTELKRGLGLPLWDLPTAWRSWSMDRGTVAELSGKAKGEDHVPTGP